MSIHSQCEDLLRQAEKLLREADDDVSTALHGVKAIKRQRRNNINAACNALHRATRAKLNH